MFHGARTIRISGRKKTIDRSKWKVLEENGCDSGINCGWKRREIDVNSKENAYIDKDGHLAIVARRAKNNISRGIDVEDDVVTSVRLSTFGSADFLHGRIEVSAKAAPGGWGGWSGIWLLPSEERRLHSASCACVNIVEVRDYEFHSAG